MIQRCIRRFAARSWRDGCVKRAKYTPVWPSVGEPDSISAHPLAEPGAALVDGDGQGQHGDDDRRGLGVMEERQLEIEQLPESARSDEAEGGRHADVHF